MKNKINLEPWQIDFIILAYSEFSLTQIKNILGLKSDRKIYSVVKEFNLKKEKLEKTSYIDIGDNLISISIRKSNKRAIIDKEDWNKVKDVLWFVHPKYNSVYCHKTINNKKRPITLHRLLLGIIDYNRKLQIDHKDLNRLNNSKSNLRFCDLQHNCFNKPKIFKSNITSKYKGVSKICRKKYIKWQAQIMFNYKNIRIGLFDTEIEAAKAYDAKAKVLFGEFARINFEE